jgi:hypothetical protein
MAAPPLSPAVKAISMVWFPPVAESPVGAEGVVDGVPDTELDGELVPLALTASKTTLYVVPFVNPVMERGLVVLPALVYEDPPFVE